MAAATISASGTSSSDLIQSLLLTNSNQLSGDIWQYSFAKSPWSKVIARGEYRKGMGDNPRAAHMQRAMVGTTNGKGTWATHSRHGVSTLPVGASPPDISTTRGNPPISVVHARAIARTFQRVWAAVESPRYDVRDFSFDWEFEKQLDLMYTAYVDAAGRMWDYKQREVHWGLCDRKVLLGVPESGSLNALADLTVLAPTDYAGLVGYSAAQLNMTGALPSGTNYFSSNHSVLTWGVLAHVKAKMDRVGAGDLKGMSGGDGTVYPLVCSPEQQYALLREPGTRDDIRYDDASDLLRGLGIKKSYNGFSFMTDVEVARFTLALNGSTYDFTEVPAYSYQTGSTSTVFTAAAAVTGNAALTKLTGVTDTSGILPGSLIRIAPTSASDDDYSGDFQVQSFIANSTVTIYKAWDADVTVTGIIYNNTNGVAGWVENDAYSNAPYEETRILHPEMMKILIPNYPETVGNNGMTFDADCAIGEFNWLNIQNEVTNPDNSFGYWRGVMEFAAEPGKTEFGWSIIHRRANAIVLAAPSALTLGTYNWWA